VFVCVRERGRDGEGEKERWRACVLNVWVIAINHNQVRWGAWGEKDKVRQREKCVQEREKGLSKISEYSKDLL